MVVAAAAALLAFPALAAEPPTPVRLGNAAFTRGVLDDAADVDRFSARLTRGEDYAVGAAAGGASFVVLDPAGRRLARLFDDGTQEEGVELRAARTGTYIIEVRAGRPPYPTGYFLKIGSDCRKDRTTRCTLRPGQTQQQRAFTYAFDEDWHRLSLRAGRTYALTPEADQVNTVAFVDARGRTLAAGFGFTSVTFRPTRSGTYYAELKRDDDFGGTYRVSLAER